MSMTLRELEKAALKAARDLPREVMRAEQKTIEEAEKEAHRLSAGP